MSNSSHFLAGPAALFPPVSPIKMNRKGIRGRASLSFPATQGILDMDQILQTDPWNQIDDFVQCNFIQDVLNEFNDRMALDPKHAPAGKQKNLLFVLPRIARFIDDVKQQTIRARRTNGQRHPREGLVKVKRAKRTKGKRKQTK